MISLHKTSPVQIGYLPTPISEAPTEIVISQRTDAWLELRQEFFSATNASLIMGSNPYSQDPHLELFNNKTGTGSSIRESERMTIGSALEETVIRLGFKKIFGEHWENLWQHLSYGGVYARLAKVKGSYVPIMASLDALYRSWAEDAYGEIVSSYVPIEAKCTAVTEWKRYGGQPYPHHVDQVQHQLAVMRADYGWIIYLVGNERVEVFKIEANKDRQKSMLLAYSVFLQDCFPEGESPKAPSPLDPKEAGMILEADDFIGPTLVELSMLKRQKAELESKLDEASEIVKQYISHGNAAGATYGGVIFDLVPVKGRATTNWQGLVAYKNITPEEVLMYTTNGEATNSLRERKAKRGAN